jgi:predicted metalloprotease with PDZ domain
LGEGYVDLVAPAQVLAECYYAAGPLSVFPSEAKPNSAFNMYWLSAPPFDIDWVAQRIQTLFSFESRLFKDSGGSYRILIRKNPYAGGGGTALHRSFMFGWSEQIPTKRDDLQYLLAHEMTHTWPVLEGEHGETSWYSEGNAEYLSILSLWRAGLITADEFLRAINERARRYYTNPQQHLSNAEAEQHYWQDINASHVPYGRGWTYLVSVDAQIRRATRGKRELSDIVVTLTQDARDGRPHGVSRWIDLVTEEIGPRAKRDYEQMAYGHTIIPPADSFAPCFIRQRYRAPTFDLGFDQASLRGDRQTVQGLIPQSNAAIAGLQNGDHILKATTLEDAIGTQRMVIQVQRANGTVEVSYAPEGVSVGAIRWVRNRAVSDRACKY